MAQINGSCSLGRNYGFYLIVDVSGSYPNASCTVKSYVVNGDRRFNSNNWWFECTVNGVKKTSGRGINIASNYTDYWAACGPLTYGTDSGSGTSMSFSFSSLPPGDVSISYKIYKSTSYSSYDPGEMTASGTFSVGRESRSVVVNIANMDQYGNYASPWKWIDTTVGYGLSVDYWGYGSASGPDNAIYNPVHYSNSSVTSNINTTLYASRQTYYLDLNGVLDGGAESGSLGGYGTTNVKINGTQVSTAVGDYYAAHYYGSTYEFSGITAATGRQYDGVYSGKTSGTIEGTTKTILKFSTKSYNVAYNANGGSSTPTTQSGKYGGTVKLSSAISRANSDSNVTISVSYNANGGTGAPSASTGTAVNTTPYSFNKWALNGTSGTQYSAGATYTIPASNSTMYALWTAGTTTRKSNPSITLSNTKPTKGNSTVSSYDVSYNANGGSSTPTKQTATKTRSYTFSKWNGKSDGSGTDYNANTAYTFSANTTLYAKYTTSDSGGSITLPAAITRANSDSNVTITITYNANNGSGAPAASTGTAVNTTPYTFNKWAAGSTTGTAYAAGASFTPTAATTMYATWTTGTTTRKSNPSITLSSTAPTRSGYIFKGWNTSSTATTSSYNPGTAYTFSANTTLYAVWEEDQAKVKTKVNGSWVSGRVWVKQNGAWVKATKIYTKSSGAWKKSV